jgi:hypothetical protein
MDETYPKEFLEYLMDMCDRIDRGEEKLIQLDENFFNDLKDLVGEDDKEL